MKNNEIKKLCEVGKKDMLPWLRLVADQYGSFIVFYRDKGHNNFIEKVNHKTSVIYLSSRESKLKQTVILFHEIGHKKLKHFTKKMVDKCDVSFHDASTKDDFKKELKKIARNFPKMIAAQPDADNWAYEEIGKRLNLFSKEEIHKMKRILDKVRLNEYDMNIKEIKRLKEFVKNFRTEEKAKKIKDKEHRAV